jgi:hypothetical protein
VGRDSFTSGAVEYNSLALAANGTAYLAFRDAAAADRATVMVQQGQGWAALGSAGLSAGSAKYTSLALDSSGVPFLAFADGSLANKATVMTFSGGTWATVGNAGLSAGGGDGMLPQLLQLGSCYRLAQLLCLKMRLLPLTPLLLSHHSALAAMPAGAAYFVSLAISPLTNAPHVAYQDWGASNKATVMAWSSGIWAPLGPAGFTPGAARDTSLAIDSAGTVYLAFHSTRCSVMKFDGAGWATVGNAYLSAGIAQYISLRLNSAGVPLVAFSDAGVGYRASVMTLAANGTWLPLGAAGFSAARADYTSMVSCRGREEGKGGPCLKQERKPYPLVVQPNRRPDSPPPLLLLLQALDSAGTPFVGFSDASVSNAATVMTFSGGAWAVVSFVGVPPGAVSFTSVAIDPLSSVPWLAYADAANGNRAVVKKQGWGPPRCA